MGNLKKIGKFLFSMKFGIILLIIMILACLGGSVIPQGEISAYYTGYYPEKIGMLILITGFSDVFHCWWFVILTLLICVNLLGCNLFHFPKLLNRTRNGYSLDKCLTAWDGTADAVISSAPETLFRQLGFHKAEEKSIDGRSYRYAIRNKIGIWGAWLTHLGLLIIIVGFTLGQIFTVKYTVYGVVGQTLPVEDTDYTLTINDFHIDLREDETVEQYTSNVTVTDTKSGDAQTGDTSVNHPAKLHGMSIFQNSTGWAATALVFKDEELIQSEILCAGEHLAIKDFQDLVVALNAFYPDYAQDASGSPYTASSELNNPAYLYTVYYQGRVLGMNVLQEDYITIDDYTIAFVDPQQYTLIQLKRDPFTWIALIGGALLLFALLVAFYLRTEEIWAVQNEDGTWQIAGKSRKGGLLFHEAIVSKAANIK